jgi:hypothetical protein
MKKTIKLNAIQRIAIIAIAAVMALAFTTCEGAEGPMGPQGPAGGQGPQGPTGAADPATCEHYWWSEWVETRMTATTCLESNELRRICIKCLHEEERNIPGHHLWSGTITVTQQPTETTSGLARGDCSRVGCATPTNAIGFIPAWNKYYGTWKKSGSYDTLIIIDKNNFKCDDDDGSSDHLYFSISSWGTAGLNTNSNQSDKDAIPFYQQIVGTTTSQQYYGSTTTVTLGLNVNGTLSVSTSGSTSLSASGTSGNFVKQ